jgi:hypothetical protein
MREIRGEAKTIRQLLSGTRYAIDFYQREYKWQTKQVRELLDDLGDRFLEYFKTSDDRSAVAEYGHYFLGSIILSKKDQRVFVVDGQQRLTTLTLLLIHLRHRLPDNEDKATLQDLIFSKVHGHRAFNLSVDERVAVDERTACMEALFKGEVVDSNGQPESIRNICDRYADIQNLLPDEITQEALPLFADWLIENVHLVEISAYSDDDAYVIFETMNDRGLSLSPLDMLKGFLLANITDEKARLRASTTWKQQVAALGELGKDEDADAFKAWLRSQYAESIRDTKKGAQPMDFDRLGTEFHRWVRDSEKRIGLNKSTDFARFIETDMAFYTNQYVRLRRAAEQYTATLPAVFFIARYEYTLQYPVLLAPLSPDDTEQTILRKVRVTAAFLDIWLARRLWNFKLIAYSTMQRAIWQVIKDIRRCTITQLVEKLTKHLVAVEETFPGNDRLKVHQQNRYYIHQLLARITDFVEIGSGQPSRFAEFVAEGKDRYEVEHIWANHPERFQDEFKHPADFDDYRNRFGGLLLLPKKFNASYGDMTYAKKLPHYLKQNGPNMLARSLHPESYTHNPGFVRFVKQSGLKFKSHEEFKKKDLDDRQDLYRRIAEVVWSPDRLRTEAVS